MSAEAATTAAGLADPWVAQSGTVRSSTTSTSSLLLPSGLVRTYYLDGDITQVPQVVADRGSLSLSFASTTTATLTLPGDRQVALTRYTF